MEEKVDIKTFVSNSESCLLKIRTMFPFTFFPNEILIYRNKVVIVQRFLPFTKKEFPMLISDIKSVTVSVGPVFASMFFEISGFEKNPEKIEFLKRSEALDARKIITGLILMSKKEIATNDMEGAEILTAARQLG